MVKRPYIKYSIIELEKLFESSKNDSTIIEEIHNELHFRKTNRAFELLNKVEETARDEEKTLNKKRVEELSLPSSSNAIEFEVDNLSTYSANAAEDASNKTPFPDEKKHSFNNDQHIHPGVDQIFAAWMTLEVLTPQAIPNAQELEVLHRKLIRLEDNPEPWKDNRFNKKGKETAIYWMVYLGELDLSKAVESMLKAFPDETPDERSEIRGNTTLAVVVLDAQGRPVLNKMFLSSFAWGYGKVRSGSLKELASFIDEEKYIKNNLERKIVNQNEEGEIQPVCSPDIYKIIEWLIEELNLPMEEVSVPGIAVRVPQFSSFSEAPEPELLNSFFIDDIFKIRNAFYEGNVSQALMTYMGVNKTRARQDIVQDQSLLSETLAPIRLPLTRWPGRGRYPLYLMQQAAINHSVKELAVEGMVSVNGPPGTGKTTLLRDIVANVVLGRALAMTQFENPKLAFSHIANMKTGKAFSHLYQLDDSLLGHEIVIASSNNKAVENISLEIPSSSAIADDFEPPLKYFQAISDAVAANDKEIIDGTTWGLAAAALGNNANKFAFINAFWWDKQRGMASYLSAIINGGMTDTEGETDEDNNQPFIPEIVRLENPPKNEMEALERWQTVRKEFFYKLKKVERLIIKAQDIYTAVNKKAEAIKNIENIVQKLSAAEKNLKVAQDGLNSSILNHEKALNNERKAVDDRASLELLRPGFFARLFKTNSYREWHQRMVNNIRNVDEARVSVQKASSIIEQSQNLVNSITSIIVSMTEEKSKFEKLFEILIRTINEGQKLMGVNLADDLFWQQDDKIIQVLSPWIFKDLQDARDDLFRSSFAVHQAFIDAAAKLMRQNIRSAIEILKGRSLTDQQEPARRSLWASLFMVVPVISTTFASTSRLFGRLGQEQLGWLLIDEAGQATPQAALGAIWRAKRTIVIGDPLQIEPVVAIPKRLVNSIFLQFGVSSDEWAAPDVSTQILADRSSWLGTVLNSDDGELWVGAPLRVHRRCENPMFSISNFIAYNGIMVYGTKSDHSSIGEILGQSIWINVDGEANGKWSGAEGKVVLRILKQLLDSGVTDPDVFFITPFRMVSFKLRELIRNDRWITERLPKKAWEWTNERIGTIHTFQGKEADAVVLVLGAPSESSAGARRWAGGIPNLLNVAVTRAKRRLYVIGNHQAWKNEGYFKYLSISLPLHKEKS